jgi:hypothetical protein
MKYYILKNEPEDKIINVDDKDYHLLLCVNHHSSLKGFEVRSSSEIEMR